MSEILATVPTGGTNSTWLILECGHWYKWTGPKPPETGQDFPCPFDKTISVVKPQCSSSK